MITQPISKISQENNLVPAVVSLSPTDKVALDRDRISYPVPLIFVNALETVDKKFLKYDYAKSKVSKTYQAKTDTFLKALKNQTKEQLPRIDLQTGTIQGVFADFDSLEEISKLVPASFSTDWYQVRRWLACKFSNGCVFPSASGKAKVFFPFTEAGLTTAKAKNRLKTLVGDYISAIDPAGVRYSFINTDGYGVLAQWLKSIEYTQALERNNQLLNTKTIEETREGKVIVSTEKAEYKWNYYKGILPENMISDLLTKAKKEKHTLYCEEVIRHALGTNTSISTGVAIPQKLVAKTFGFSQRAASETIKFLKNNGVIKKVANEKAHYRAAKYVFCGFWVSVASNIFKTDSRAISGKIQTILDGIKDGNYNESLWKLTNFFRSEKEYMEKVLTIPGIHQGTRLNQALNAWKCHIKNDTEKVEMVKYA